MQLIKDPEIYNAWLQTPMQFWQNQLNFAVWCATTGSGISKEDHLQSKDPIIRSVFRFHAYYQIRRILNEMQCSLPNDPSFDPINNRINKKMPLKEYVPNLVFLLNQILDRN